MVLIGLIGEMRSGKTLLMTMLGYQEHKKGNTILANYHPIYSNHFLVAEDIKEAIAQKNTDFFKGCTLLIDEIHIWIDSRMSMSKKNVAISYFVTQSGKLDTTVYWTSQFLRQVDIRLKLNTSILYKTIRLGIINGKWQKLRQDDKRTDFKIRVERYEQKETIKQTGFMKTGQFEILNPSKYFYLYDTKETVNE